MSKKDLRTDEKANIRGGAALLASYQKRLTGPPPRIRPTGTARSPATAAPPTARARGCSRTASSRRSPAAPRAPPTTVSG
ncbi:hypothetical protein NKH77_46140 [Streptomyces sp. M19]